MRWLLFIIFSVIVVRCQQPSSVKQRASLKDSIVKRYLADIDSLDYYDKTDQDYRMLRAYANNDTAFFVEMKRVMDLASEYIYPPRLDSCVKLKKLSDLSVGEAYRFYHGQSFCDYSQRITITRSGKIVQLHYVEYSNGDGHTQTYVRKNGDTIKILPYCVLSKEFKKELSMKDWEGLQQRLFDADYWGLKPYDYTITTDGSFWQIEACIRDKWTSGIERTNSVWRQCSCGSAFKELGKYFLYLSGEKTACGDFR